MYILLYFAIIFLGIAKWSHIENFYNADKNNPIHVYATKLTDSHLKPNIKQQMRVNLAAQIFSNSVSGGILAKISSGKSIFALVMIRPLPHRIKLHCITSFAI